MSTDAGLNWSFIGLNFTTIDALAVDGNDIYVAENSSGGELYLSQNNGGT
jgi:hypothetical protein